MQAGALKRFLNGLMPCSIAAARTNGLKEDPLWRPGLCVARLNLSCAPGPKKSRPPTIART